jgi:hypothetical protein
MKRGKKSRGAILFAFNNTKYNYYDMAVHTAQRINHFLNLPVTLVTDKETLNSAISDYKFDKVKLVTADKNNNRDGAPWINKGRYQAYKLSPYKETLLLDVDYVVNSDKLLKCFDLYDDFCCHDNTEYFMQPRLPQEVLSVYSYKTLWATVVAFKKTERAEQIFNCIEMIQNNFGHYANMHHFLANIFRNDYALTLALRIVNGHTIAPQDIIPWNLMHVGKNTNVIAASNSPYNTEYTVLFDNWQRGKIRKEFITIKDMDFHVMNKDIYVELIKNG